MKQHRKNSNLHRWLLSIPKDLWEWFRAFAKKQGKSQSLLISEILQELRQKHEK
jgi:hypothetical protein